MSRFPAWSYNVMLVVGNAIYWVARVIKLTPRVLWHVNELR